MENYPASLEIDYPEESDRISVLFRFFLVIPIAIVLGLLGGVGYSSPVPPTGGPDIYITGIVFLPALLTILFLQKYPRWWFEWNLELTRFSMRVGAYALLLRDEYPSTDEEQAIHLDLEYPSVEENLTRWMPLVKWFLAIPHYFVLAFLGIAVFFGTIFAWFAILFTGQYPRALYDLVVGTLRWALRVEAYAFLLITDEYPPFRMRR